MNEVKEKLITMAREHGICNPGYERMTNAEDIDALIAYYVENPDWCLERNFPDLQTLTSYFANIEDKGVFVGKTFNGEVLNDLQAYIFHNCKGTVKVGLNVESGIIPMLYVANRCQLRFMGIGDTVPKYPDRSVVPVYSFGRNDISAHDNKYVRFIHYKSDTI